jgi:hypothetical protein
MNFLIESEMLEALHSYVLENWQGDMVQVHTLSCEEAVQAYFYDDPYTDEWFVTHEAEFTEPDKRSDAQPARPVCRG